MTTSYADLPSAEIHQTLEIIQNNGDYKFDPEKTRILKQDLGFTDGWYRLVCEDYSSLPYKKADFLRKGKDIVRLHYTPNPYTENHFDKLGLHLSEDTIMDYLSFYFDYYLSKQERFKPVSHVDDLEWQDDLAPMTRQSLEKELKLYPKIKQAGDGFFIYATCLFRYSIMEIYFFVTGDGKVEIKDYRVLVDDLPVKSFP